MSGFKFYCVVFLLVWKFSASAQITKADSLLLAKHRLEVIREQVSEEDSLMSIEEIEANWGTTNLDQGEVKYAPDGSFKIATLILESCGAYCNSEWYSWIHYNLKTKERVEQMDFYTVDTIYQLPEEKYLVIGSHGHRPAGVLGLYCITPNLISFEADSVKKHRIEYKNKKTESNSFEFCQESGVDTEGETYVRYDGAKKILNYRYANNYAYSNEVDIDTIRQGQFINVRGFFILEKEAVKVIDRRKLPATTEQWTEHYRIRDSDTENIHVGRINRHQLVYDCLGCRSSYWDAMKVYTISKGIKKALLTLPLGGASLEKISLIKIDGYHFIYILTSETSGNTDGYLYYLNPVTMKAYEVKVEKAKPKLPKGCQPWGSYAYLIVDEKTSEVSSSSQFMDATGNRRGTENTQYRLYKLKSNQFLLKIADSSAQFDE